MWKLVASVASRLLPRHQQSYSFQLRKRLFFSNSFKLENEWNNRLKSPILSKINTNDMFYELDHQFQHFACASAIDIDIFVNAVNDDSSFDEVEDVVHKLRLSSEAINILPSTHHAIIRLYIKYNKTDELLRVLDDRLNYGIFSDDYSTLLLMDSFIKEGNFKDAAKLSTLKMLQEDISNPLVKYMSLYSCHKYLENPVPWKKEDEEQKEEEDDDEEVKVRVRYILNPYFDDHFDLVDSKHLIGKTFHMIGSEIEDHVGRSYKLLGLLLHDKFKQAEDYLRTLSVSEETPILVKDVLTIANNILDEKIKNDGEDKNVHAFSDSIKELLNKSFPDSQLALQNNLLEIAEACLRDLAGKNESSEINKQLQMYSEWETNRVKLLQEQIAKINREKQLAEIQRQKQLLKEKEEELFFFDNEDKIDLVLEEKEKKKEEQMERQRQRMLAKTKIVEKPVKEKPEPPLDSFFDENIPMKLIKTKL